MRNTLTVAELDQVKERNGGMNAPAFSAPKINDGRGLTKREYAAILLRVPDSGSNWLDEMIGKSITINR